MNHHEEKDAKEQLQGEGVEVMPLLLKGEGS